MNNGINNMEILEYYLRLHQWQLQHTTIPLFMSLRQQFQKSLLILLLCLY